MSVEVLRAISTWREGPVDYSTSDCCRFVGHVLQELHGVDYLQGFEYSSEAEANALLDPDLTETVTRVLQTKPMPRRYLKPGDVCLWRLKQSHGLGVVLQPGGASFAATLTNGRVRELRGTLIDYGWIL